MAVVRKTRADPSHPCPSVFYSNCPYVDVAGERPDGWSSAARGAQRRGVRCNRLLDGATQQEAQPVPVPAKA